VKNNHNVSRDFKVNDAVYNDFLSYVGKQEIKYTQADLDSTAGYIRTALASEIIGKQYGETAAYKITLGLDAQFQNAMDLFNKYTTMDEMFAHAARMKSEEDK
jgi:carboxyl-terminal processing protease